MSTPTAVFLDTSVLAGQQFNFSSTVLSTFVPACTSKSLKLLLPDPTEREVRRQLSERAAEAMVALDEVLRRAPFLAKWSRFPARRGTYEWMQEHEARATAFQAWNEFLRQFDVVRLAYDGLDMQKVMNWYDGVEAPFRQGKKRKEFPDAFAIALLEAYANKNSCYIAVVSEDLDFKLACARFPCLLHFSTLPRLTELLLAEDDRVKAVRDALERDMDQFIKTVQAEVDSLAFVHDDGRFDVEDTSEPTIEVTDLRVVAVGDNEATVTFDLDIDVEARLKWDKWRHPNEEWPEKNSTWVNEVVVIGGTAKIKFDPGFGKPSEIGYVALDQDQINVSATPRYW